VPFPVAGNRHRVDREHLIAGRDQRGDPRAAVGLDPHHELPVSEPRSGVVKMLGDQRVQPGHPGHALGQPSSSQPPPVAVEDLDIVVILAQSSPTNSTCTASSRVFSTVDGSAKQGHRDLMVKCSPTRNQPSIPRPGQGQGTSSHQRSDLPMTSGHTI
jgi:hypothetical protein